MPGACGGQKVASEALELELQMAVNPHVGARNWTLKTQPVPSPSPSSTGQFFLLHLLVQPLQTLFQASGTLFCALPSPQTLQFQETIQLTLQIQSICQSPSTAYVAVIFIIKKVTSPALQSRPSSSPQLYYSHAHLHLLSSSVK